MVPSAYFVLVFVAIFAAIGHAKIKPASNYFDICHTSEPNYNECAKKSLSNLQPLITKGMPDLKIDKFEPLRISKIEMGDGSGKFQLHFVLSNLLIRGMSKYKIVDMDVNIDKLKMSYTVYFPKLDFEGDYLLEGQLLVVPVKGNGMSVLNFTDVTTTSNVQLEEIQKKGQTYIRIKDYKLRIDPKGARSHFSNLFNGDKRLGESTNKFMNDNWHEAFDAYRELPEKAFSEFLKSIANRVFSLFPKDELFPK